MGNARGTIGAIMSSVVLLGASSALQSTVVALRAGILGFSDTSIGLIVSAYFVGFVIGSFVVVRLVRSVGYVRSFAALAALAAATVLAHTLIARPWIWGIFRALHGLALAGALVVVESWLNACSTTYNRGRILSIYSLVYLASMGAGQPLLGVFSPREFQIFAVVSMLMALSLVPISLVQVTGTPQADRAPVRPAKTFRRSPLAAIGVFMSGVTAEALWGLAPRYAQQIDLGEAAIGTFMLAVSLGALTLQWPLGWLSDRYDRRFAILGAAGAAALAALLFALIPTGPQVFVLAFLLGAFVMPLYSLCIALVNDELTPGEMVGAASALVLFYGIGSAVGPALASLAMSALGPSGLYAFLAVATGAFFVFSLIRLQIVPRLPRRHGERYHWYPRTTFAAFALLRRGAGRRAARTQALRLPPDRSRWYNLRNTGVSRIAEGAARMTPRFTNRPRVRPLAPAVGIVLLALIGLSGCATLSDAGYYFNLWRASRAGDRFYRNYEPGERDVAFTEVSDVRLDVYSPEEGDGHPVLIFVHGGGWDKYDKQLFAPVAMQLVPRDLVVVIPDYTLYPDATYRQMSREVAAAVAWTFDHIDAYGGDPDRVVLSGHSAGGHLSGLVALDGSWLAEFDHSPDELCGWVGLSGVYDVAAQMAFERAGGGEAPVMTAVMEGEENFPAASPITYIRGGAAAHPPVIRLIHGALDETVPVSMSTDFAERLEAAGLPVELTIYPESDHADFLFEGLTDDNARVLLDLTETVRGCAE